MPDSNRDRVRDHRLTTGLSCPEGATDPERAKQVPGSA